MLEYRMRKMQVDREAKFVLRVLLIYSMVCQFIAISVNLLENFTRLPFLINIQIDGNPFLGVENRVLEFFRPNRGNI